MKLFHIAVPKGLIFSLIKKIRNKTCILHDLNTRNLVQIIYCNSYNYGFKVSKHYFALFTCFLMTEVIVPCKESWSSDVTITATKSVALPITADTAKKKKKL